jgi:hypothetical protein
MLQREPQDDPHPDRVDFVTLRFWAPSATTTLKRLRESNVLPDATSVYSVRVRVGEPDAYAVAEAFHNGKLTSVGTSFTQHSRIVTAALEQYVALAETLEASPSGTRRITIPLRWTGSDLGYAVGRMFGGGEPFRLWGLPVQTGEQQYTVRALDLDTGHVARFEITREAVSFELGSGAAASLATRFVANLQYHVSSALSASALAPEPLVARSGQPARHTPPPPFEEVSPVEEVARAVLVDACALWVLGHPSLSAQRVLAHAMEGRAGTPSMLDLVRRVLTEVAAHEWHEVIRPVLAADGSTHWRFHDALPSDGAARTRELTKLNRAAEHAVARLSGRTIAPWLQLSLFSSEALVPAVAEDEDRTD